LQQIRANGNNDTQPLFESELREAKSCDERGDYFGALGHKLFAEMIYF
jgi:hypothetical protein